MYDEICAAIQKHLDATAGVVASLVAAGVAASQVIDFLIRISDLKANSVQELFIYGFARKRRHPASKEKS